MEFKHYAGIDVSKNTLDVTVIGNLQSLPFHLQIQNNLTGFKQLIHTLKGKTSKRKEIKSIISL